MEQPMTILSPLRRNGKSHPGGPPGRYAAFVQVGPKRFHLGQFFDVAGGDGETALGARSFDLVRLGGNGFEG